MVDYETFMKIKMEHQNGLTCPQIADKLEINARTVQKWLDKSRYCQRKSTPKSGKLDPFKNYIVSRLHEYPFSAIQIFRPVQLENR